MVRLKANEWETRPAVVAFQFHYGTIKSPFSYEILPEDYTFQFHYGTIKSVDLSAPADMVTNFNSTMVRLKERSIRGIQQRAKLFQFHYGTIKRGDPVSFEAHITNFNSTMVRLKVDVVANPV